MGSYAIFPITANEMEGHEQSLLRLTTFLIARILIHLIGFGNVHINSSIMSLGLWPTAQDYV